MQEHVAWSDIVAYLDGELPPERRTTIEQWLAETGKHAAHADDLQAIWQLAGAPARSPDDVETAIRGVRARIAQDTASGSNDPSPEARPSVASQRQSSWKLRALASMQRRVWATLAAGTVVLLLVLAGREFLGTGSSTDSGRRYHTRGGERMTVQLADGSSMILAPVSTVTVHATHVEVSGEAYFTVAPNAARPVTVRTSDAEVRVLGTSFSVRRYGEERATRVVVEDGKVSVHPRVAPSSSHILPAGLSASAVLTAQALAYVSDSGVAVTPSVSTREYTQWTKGILVFNRIPLRDVVTELSRAYGVKIHVADSALAAEPIIAEFEVHRQSLAHVLNAIGYAIRAHYVQSDSAFLLSPGRNPRVEPAGHKGRNQFPESEKDHGGRYGR